MGSTNTYQMSTCVPETVISSSEQDRSPVCKNTPDKETHTHWEIYQMVTGAMKWPGCLSEQASVEQRSEGQSLQADWKVRGNELGVSAGRNGSRAARGEGGWNKSAGEERPAGRELGCCSRCSRKPLGKDNVPVGHASFRSSVISSERPSLTALLKCTPRPQC